MRPIVFGGDDVTFVCKGRLGLALAVRYLQSYAGAAQTVDRAGGVAVVKAHYPFSHAYDLAEELCKSAKDKIADFKLSGKESATVIDWHFSTSGVVLGLEEVRQREYSAENGDSLLMRPVWLDPTPGQNASASIGAPGTTSLASHAKFSKVRCGPITATKSRRCGLRCARGQMQLFSSCAIMGRKTCR